MSAQEPQGGADANGPHVSAVLTELSFTLTVADLVAAQRAHLRGLLRRIGRSKALWVVILLAVLAGGAGVWLDAGQNASGELLLTVGLIAGCAVVGGALGLLIPYLLMPRSCRRLMRQQKSLSQTWHAELREDGLRVASPSQQGFVIWANYIAWHRGKRMVLLYHNDRLFQMIPAHAVTARAWAVFDDKLAGLPQR